MDNQRKKEISKFLIDFINSEFPEADTVNIEIMKLYGETSIAFKVEYTAEYLPSEADANNDGSESLLDSKYRGLI